jgi:hypothetical protein
MEYGQESSEVPQERYLAPKKARQQSQSVKICIASEDLADRFSMI